MKCSELIRSLSEYITDNGNHDVVIVNANDWSYSVVEATGALSNAGSKPHVFTIYAGEDAKRT